MKNVMMFFTIIGFAFTAIAQDTFEKTTVQILADSELTITGDTNINKFCCAFNTSMLERSKEMEYKAIGSKVVFKDAVLNLNNRGFDCGNKAINKDFHALLQTEKYPEISLELLEVNLSQTHAAVDTVKISMAGKQKKL